MTKRKPEVPRSIRGIPDELWAKARARAEAEGRSVSNWLRRLVERALR